jgi:hypothetical protein
MTAINVMNRLQQLNNNNNNNSFTSPKHQQDTTTFEPLDQPLDLTTSVGGVSSTCSSSEQTVKFDGSDERIAVRMPDGSMVGGMKLFLEINVIQFAIVDLRHALTLEHDTFARAESVCDATT